MNIFSKNNSKNTNSDISSNSDTNSTSYKDEIKEFLWFIGSITTSIVSILTASILLINLGREYKKKRPYQFTILLLGGIILLFVSSYININVINYLKLYSNKYQHYVLMLKSILFITICFIIHVLHMIRRNSKHKKR